MFCLAARNGHKIFRNNQMKNRFILFAAFICSAICSALFPGQNEVFAADKSTREEFQQAERILTQKQVDAESVQQEIGRLEARRSGLEKELTLANTKLAAIDAKLTAAVNQSSTGDEIDKLKREAALWETRKKNAETEIARIDASAGETIRSLQKTMQGGEGSEFILPGESLEVIVMEDDSLNSLYQVRRGGYIIMPRVGRISVAGKDLQGAEKAIKEKLQESQIKEATVMVERSQGNDVANGPVVYLAGEFIQPGSWKIPPGVLPTTVTTILRSGGVTSSGDLTRVRVLRLVSGQGLVEEVNVQAILDGIGLASDLTLNAGDIIMIPAFANVVYVTGNVEKPGTLKLLPDDELTAYSAILRCGGFSRFAKKSGVHVLRDRGNGAKQMIPVNIKDLDEGNGSDVVLESKDIVVVPEKFFSF
jgi:protein involved in polysaccharide export with SLBB domain